MAVARQVSRLAVGDTTMMVAPVTYAIDSSLKQEDRAAKTCRSGRAASPFAIPFRWTATT